MIDNNIMDIRKSTIACSIRKRINLYRESGGMAQDREPKVVIGWVPGYKGIVENEDADGIAKGSYRGSKG